MGECGVIIYMMVTGNVLSTSNSPNLMEGQASILVSKEIACAWHALVNWGLAFEACMNSIFA